MSTVSFFVTDADIQEYYDNHQTEVEFFHNNFAFALSDANEGYIADSSLSAFFLRELESIETRTYDTKYKKLKYADLIPIDTADDPGAETITYRRYTKVGIAKFIADYADDAPRCDVYGDEISVKAKTIGDSFGYSRQEIRRSRMHGKSLDQLRANSARRAVEEKLNSVAWDGDSAYGYSGLIDYPGITEYTVPNGAAAATEWTSKTPDEVVADLSGIVTAVITSTNGVESPDTMLMPIAQFEYVNNTRMTGDSSMTILKYFLTNNQHIKTVDWLTELDGAGAGGADRFMVYSRNRETLAFKIPMPYTQLPPQEQGYGFKILTETRTAGTVVYYPLAVAFGDGI